MVEESENIVSFTVAGEPIDTNLFTKVGLVNVFCPIVGARSDLHVTLSVRFYDRYND